MNGTRRPGPGRRGGFAGWFRAQFDRRPKPLWMVVAADILLIGVSLVIFALFHHVLPRRETSVGLVSSREAAASDKGAIAAVTDETDAMGAGDEAVNFDLDAMTGEAISFSEDGEGDAEAAEGGEDEAEAAGEPSDAASDSGGKLVGDLFAGLPGDFGVTFADKFSGGKVTKSDTGYRSANVNVSLKSYKSDDVVFYAADIYVRDITCLVSAFANDTFGKGQRERARLINKRLGGVIAINGDYYGGRDDGIVIRNGELYRSDSYPNRDICVLFWDGTMETYGPGKFDAQAAIDNGAYQAWNFGPRLLDDNGKAKTRFNSDVGHSNPRTAIGYFEPGHYCFVVVDGRSDSSGGLTLTELAALMEKLGCQRAYNLDGGNTSAMVMGAKLVNHPSGGGRETSDIIAIVDKKP